MKKSIRYTAMVSFLFLFVISSAYGDLTDRPADGKKIVEKSTFMIDAGQKLKDAKNPERAWLTEQGEIIKKKGVDAADSSQMMKTREGIGHMRRIGQMLLQTGNILIKMGRQKGALTPEENKKILKQADKLQSFGKMMLKNGQVMGG